MITYKKGSITDATESIIVHGCNAQGKMRSGVAKVLREKWPEATWNVYSEKYDKNGLTVGEVIFGKQDGKIVANAITQEFYGYDGKLYLSYEGLKEALKIIDRTYFDIDHDGYVDIAMPRIGSGLAGGEWSIIEKIIQDNVINRDVIIYDI